MSTWLVLLQCKSALAVSLRHITACITTSHSLGCLKAFAGNLSTPMERWGQRPSRQLSAARSTYERSSAIEHIFAYGRSSAIEHVFKNKMLSDYLE
jgi:hypothetical protein